MARAGSHSGSEHNPNRWIPDTFRTGAKGSAPAQCSPAHRTGNGAQGTSHYHVLIPNGEGGKGELWPGAADRFGQPETFRQTVGIADQGAATRSPGMRRS
jgi:hypothetical protein